MKALTHLRSTFDFINTAFDGRKIPVGIRHSLELLRKCHKDLQHLIELRDKHLESLETHSHLLNRVDDIIKAAQEGLAEASHFVEKCRPEARSRGKTPLLKRAVWVLNDSFEFRGQEPMICRHHADVLTAVNFLGQNALPLVPSGNPRAVESDGTVPAAANFENLVLLEDIMGREASNTCIPSFEPAAACSESADISYS